MSIAISLDRVIQDLVGRGKTSNLSVKPSQCLGRSVKPSFALAGNRLAYNWVG